MLAQTEKELGPPQFAGRPQWYRPLVVAAGAALLIFLCWRIVAPFLPTLCWALALAIIAEPVHRWLISRSLPRSLSALIVIVLVLILVFAPAVLLSRALAGEASDILSRVASDAGAERLRQTVENSKLLGLPFRWLDSQLDLPKAAEQIASSAAGWASVTLSALLTGSMWLLSQVAVTVFVLFYFLRDGPTILDQGRTLIPLPTSTIDAIVKRIAQTLRVSLAGKFLVASIQGSLGGLMFFWLGLPAPVFWGSVMAFFSLFPVLGAFVVWLPAALMFAVQGDWRHAALLCGWGVIIIHPIDNLLGPVLVGTTLRLHSLLMFFSIIGGLAAFGASGVVLGPLIIAITVPIFEELKRHLLSEH